MADDQNESPDDARGLRKQLQEALERAQRAEAEAESAKQAAARDAAFAKAGVPDSPLGQMFAKSYDGDLTPDAVRKAAIDVGLLSQERTTPDAERETLMSLQDEQPSVHRQTVNPSRIDELSEQIKRMPDGDNLRDAVTELLRANGLY